MKHWITVLLPLTAAMELLGFVFLERAKGFDGYILGPETRQVDTTLGGMPPAHSSVPLPILQISNQPRRCRMPSAERSTTEEYLKRIEARGYRLDLSAYDGLAPAILQADLGYIAAAVDLVGGEFRVTRGAYHLLNDRRREIARPPKENREAYRKWRKAVGNPFPINVVVEDKGREPIPIKLVPSPVRLQAWIESLTPEQHRQFRIPDISVPFERFVRDGLPYSRGIYFTAGVPGEDGEYGCPMADETGAPGGAYPKTPLYFSPAKLGKLVGHDEKLVKPSEQIRLGRVGGADLIGKVSVAEVTPNIYLVEVEKAEQQPQRYLAYPIADGNGAARKDRPWIDPVKGGRCENSVRSPLHDPRLGRHSLLKIPKPFTPGTKKQYQQERIVIGPVFSKQKPPVVVLRKDATWQPFMEDYVLDNRVSFSGNDTDTARLVCVFTNIAPSDLIWLIGALHDVDVSGLSGNEAVLKNLETLRP